jgi:hypothetical protein
MAAASWPTSWNALGFPAQLSTVQTDGTHMAHANEKPKPPAGVEPATC